MLKRNETRVRKELFEDEDEEFLVWSSKCLQTRKRNRETEKQ